MRGTAVVVAGTTIGLVLAGIPVGARTVLDPRLAREETAIDDYRDGFEMSGDVSAYVDALELAEGSVLVDVAIGYGVVLQSANPEQYVITPDRDFQAILQNPVNFEVRYLLVSNSPLDAVNRLYGPVLKTPNSPFRLVDDDWRTASGFQWQLYELRS